MNVILHIELVFTNEGQNVKSIGNKQKHERMDDLSDMFSKKHLEHHQLYSVIFKYFCHLHHKKENQGKYVKRTPNNYT